ncbi:hemoglobin cathodic subunit beta-like [Triplophysa dalaica]|uniref:hemoglobin cathodic subunit beta-like n=1 Tax=Triplophysa dalaica TaxID=1582913 RepID=UPI0024DF65F3|nr:hemoglobin cathodic subunit beta-like [Triplophysa dalaica]XP_056608399.1 hemoglobin cathodic subunit beta-like [Triplophysa dalaica]
MVEWSAAERKIVADVWGKISIDEIGPQALARLLIVYPWTQRYFASFGDLSSAGAVLGNPKVSEHGKTVLGALDKAVKNMDDIKGLYAKLSKMHYDKLNVDPDNFRLLADCLSIVVATKFGSAFSPEVQATWQKFLSVVVAALTSKYF